MPNELPPKGLLLDYGGTLVEEVRFDPRGKWRISKDVGQGLRRYETVRMRRTRQFIKLGPRNAFVQSFRSFAIRMVPASVTGLAASQSREPHRDLRR